MDTHMATVIAMPIIIIIIMEPMERRRRRRRQRQQRRMPLTQVNINCLRTLAMLQNPLHVFSNRRSLTIMVNIRITRPLPALFLSILTRRIISIKTIRTISTDTMFFRRHHRSQQSGRW